MVVLSLQLVYICFRDSRGMPRCTAHAHKLGDFTDLFVQKDLTIYKYVIIYIDVGQAVRRLQTRGSYCHCSGLYLSVCFSSTWRSPDCNGFSFFFTGVKNPKIDDSDSEIHAHR